MSKLSCYEPADIRCVENSVSYTRNISVVTYGIRKQLLCVYNVRWLLCKLSWRGGPGPRRLWVCACLFTYAWQWYARIWVNIFFRCHVLYNARVYHQLGNLHTFCFVLRHARWRSSADQSLSNYQLFVCLHMFDSFSSCNCLRFYSSPLLTNFLSHAPPHIHTCPLLYILAQVVSH